MSGQRWTVLELLRWTTDYFAEAEIESARLDAECLLAHALGCERLGLYLEFDKPVEAAERACFRELVKRRAQERVPVAQLVGRKEFWSLSFEVTPDVLVPRPETETLVGVALDLLPDREAERRVLDLGTGSGAVASALASERPKLRIVAADISREALEVAERNVSRLGFGDRIHLREADGLASFRGEAFDLVVSNPPYIAEESRDTLPPELAHEPAEALFSGADGTDMLRAIAADAYACLDPGGALAVEMAPEQTGPMVAWLREAGWAEVETHRDLAGAARVVSARRPEREG